MAAVADTLQARAWAQQWMDRLRDKVTRDVKVDVWIDEFDIPKHTAMKISFAAWILAALFSWFVYNVWIYSVGMKARRLRGGT